MARRRYNNQGGTITDNPLASGATAFNSAALANLPVVVTPDVVPVIFEPGTASMEIAWITAHTAAATTATVTRGVEGTVAVSHNTGAVWNHGPTVNDFEIYLVDGVTMDCQNGQHLVKASGITSTQLAANAVTQAKIANNAVGSGQLANNAVGTAQLATGSVTQAVLANNSVGSAQIIDGQVGTAEIANAAVTAAKLDPSAVSAAPVGTVCAYAGPSAPTGWLECDGSAISRSTYANLYAIIGTQYGAGDGSTTFNLPDGRGRTMIGVNNPPAGGLSQRLRGQTGGEETHLLVVSEMPIHSHVQNSHNHVQNAHVHTVNGGTVNLGSGNITPYKPTTGSEKLDTTGNASAITFSNMDALAATNQAVTAVNQNAGGGIAHNVMAPWFVSRWIIKT